MSTNKKHNYYVPYFKTKIEIVIISTGHLHASVPKLTKNHLKYVFIHQFSFKSEVFLPVHHEISHMDLHSLKIQLKVEYFAKSDFSRKILILPHFPHFTTKKIALILFKCILT